MKPMACFCEVFERGAVMSEIKGLFEKVKIENLMAFLVYGTDSEGESIDDYEEKLEGSYDSFLSGLERKYPGIDRNDNELMDMISDFAGAHDHVYFEAGALTGFRLCRNMDREYEKRFNEEEHDGAADAEKADPEKMLSSEMPGRRKAREETGHMEGGLNGGRFTARQWDIIEETLFMNTENGAEYGKAAYHQGFADALKLMSDMFKTM